MEREQALRELVTLVAQMLRELTWHRQRFEFSRSLRPGDDDFRARLAWDLAGISAHAQGQAVASAALRLHALLASQGPG